MSPKSALQVALVLLLSFQLSYVLAKPALLQEGITKRAPTSTSEYQTNAQRLAAGFLPLPPKRRFAPTKVALAARGAASPISFSGGCIGLRGYSNNAAIGWVGNINAAMAGGIVWTANPAQKLPLSFTYHDLGTVLEMTISDDLPYHYLGVAGDSLGPTSGTAPNLVRTNSVPSGSRSLTVGHSGTTGTSNSESYVWKFDPTSNELTGVWANPNGQVIPTYFYIPATGSTTNIRMSGHPSLNPTVLQKVRLYWES